MTASLQQLTPHAEVVSRQQARQVNVAAAMGLQAVLKSNLGPRGTLKMLVGGAGQLKLTKDGQVLLKEMQIQHPTAALIARTATAQVRIYSPSVYIYIVCVCVCANKDQESLSIFLTWQQILVVILSLSRLTLSLCLLLFSCVLYTKDDVTGDGTTSTVLLCGELLRQAERYASEGLHPRVLVDGLDMARDAVLGFLHDQFQQTKPNVLTDRDLLESVARTSLQTKLDRDLATILTGAIVDAIQCVATTPDQPIDLHRVEVMSMARKMGTDSRFVNGLVLDHGGRHPGMPTLLRRCHVMTCNITFEYEKTEVQSGFFYSTAQEREKLVESERKWLDERCKQVVDFKRSVCQDGEVRFCLALLLVTIITTVILTHTHTGVFVAVLCHD